MDVGGSEVDIVDTDDNKLAIVDVAHPLRYSRCVVTRTVANVTVDGIAAEIYYARTAPVPGHSTLAASSVVNG